MTLEWGHTPSHAEEDLILGEGNELAYRHILHFPDWPSPPWMLIEGPPSAGKSHLARIWAERAGAAMPEPGALEELATGGHRAARDFVEEYTLADGRHLYLLADGRLVNLSAGEGHPASVMDMSFANQALGVEYMLQHGGDLEPKVYTIPTEIDHEIARLKLTAMGIQIDTLTPAQKAYLEAWESGT